MSVRVLRRALLVVVTLALWAVARPALAMPAPYCDDRGATAIAAEPLLQAPEVGVQGVQRAPLEVVCDDELEVGGFKLVVTGRSLPAPFVSAEPASPPPSPVVWPVRASEPSPAFVRDRQPALDGARYRVERPPRA